MPVRIFLVRSTSQSGSTLDVFTYQNLKYDYATGLGKDETIVLDQVVGIPEDTKTLSELMRLTGLEDCPDGHPNPILELLGEVFLAGYLAGQKKN